MTGSRDKPPPPKSEDDFSDLAAELNDEPTGKFAAVAPEPAAPARALPETMPAPKPDDPAAAASRGGGAAGGAGGGAAGAAGGPRRSPSRDDVRKRTTPYGAAVARPRSEGAMYAVSTARDKWRESAAMDDLFGPPRSQPAAGAGKTSGPHASLTRPGTGAASTDEHDAVGDDPDEKRPTREAPPSEPGRGTATQTAPRPPRIPTIDPQAEFAFGFEPDPAAASGAAPTAHARTGGDEPTPVRGVPLVDAARRAGEPRPVPSDPDLSWSEHHHGDDPIEEAIPIEIEGPSAPPLPPARDLEGDAYSLVNKASLQPVAIAMPDPRRELSERFALGDFSGALVIAEALVAEGRADAQTDQIASECRARLEAMYTARLGDKAQVPSVAVPRTELKWLSLDHRAGFLLSLVDGASSIEEIIDVSGMPALEVLRTLYELMGQHVIEFHPPRR